MWILRHPKFPAPDLCTLCHLLSSLWWDAIPVIRLLISSLWLNQEGGYPGWTWLGEMSHMKETEASERYSPAGPEKSDYPAVKATGSHYNGWLIETEGLQSYKITRHWMLPIINEFPSPKWDCGPCQCLGCSLQRRWAEDQANPCLGSSPGNCKISDVLHC